MPKCQEVSKMSNMSKNVRDVIKCQKMSTGVKKYQKMSNMLRSCQRMSTVPKNS